MFAILALIFLCHGALAKLNTTIIPKGVPILFNRLADAQVSFETYRIIYAVNLTEYYRIEQQMKTAIEKLKEHCPSDPQSIRTSYCRATVLQLEKRLEEANYDDDNLAGYRIKRFCHWCGDFLHYSTGVVDADSAKIWTDHINRVQNETALQTREIYNQTAIFKTFMETNNRTTESTQKALNRLRLSLNEVSNHEEKQIAFIQQRLIDQETLQLANAALTEHERVHAKLRAIMVNTKRGRIPEIIRKDMLTQQLKDISSALPADQRLPIDINRDNPLHIFSFADLSAALFDNHLLLTIMVPITEVEHYGLYKATAVPVDMNGRRYIAKVSTDHFLLNVKHTRFIPLNREDMSNARTRSPREMLYRPTASTITNPQLVCEWRVLSEITLKSAMETCEFTPLLTHEMVIAILVNEQYFISTAQRLKIRETCGKNEKQHSIRDRTLIKIDPECSITTDNFEIRAHRVHLVNTTDTLVPDFSASELLAKQLPRLAAATYTKLVLNLTTPIVIHDTKEMNEIIKRTEELLKYEDHEFKLKDLEYDASGWSLGFIISIATLALALALALGTFFACRKFNVMSMSVRTVETTQQQMPKMVQSLAPAIIHDFLHTAPIIPSPLNDNMA